jgi:hypothetical protein
VNGAEEAMKSFGREDTMVGLDGELSPYMQACMSNQPKHLRKNSTIMLNPHRSCTFKRYLFHFIYFLNNLEQSWKRN